MELIDAKCPNCGSEVKLNREDKTAICVHCNSSFLVDDAVKKYVTNTSYNIAHATIIKSEFSDDALYNEVDKYIAQYNLRNYEKLGEIVENLKDKFPHKGLARIAILHYQFTTLFINIGSDTLFYKEAEDIEARYNNYFPKKYKHKPPYTSFLTKFEMIEMKYAEDINDLLTDSEMKSYDDIVNTTFDYLEKYNNIILFNKKIQEKYEPYENILEAKKRKKEKRKRATEKLKRYRFLILFLSIILIIVISSLSSIISNNIARKYREFVNVPNVNCLDFPIQTTSTGVVSMELGKASITLTKKYSYRITGRVAGTHSYSQNDTNNKLQPIIIGLSWGNYSYPEIVNQLNWSYSSISGGTTYKKVGSDIDKNFSTNRLIPANDKIRKLFKAIRKGDIIQIDGFLVDILIQENSKSYRATSSVTLDDDYYEIIYVTDIKWVNEIQS